MKQKFEERYINREELEKRGKESKKDGMFHQLNVLERCSRDGWLDFGNRRYSAMDRVSAGNRLGRDFYLSGLETVSANDVRRVRVDGSGTVSLPEKMLLARDRFNKAMCAIPYEFWPVVSRVCCEDKEFEVENGSERQRAYARHRSAILLCLGLDRLIGYYLKK